MQVNGKKLTPLVTIYVEDGFDEKAATLDTIFAAIGFHEDLNRVKSNENLGLTLVRILANHAIDTAETRRQIFSVLEGEESEVIRDAAKSAELRGVN